MTCEPRSKAVTIVNGVVISADAVTPESACANDRSRVAADIPNTGARIGAGRSLTFVPVRASINGFFFQLGAREHYAVPQALTSSSKISHTR
jgi:hypothetical protein